MNHRKTYPENLTIVDLKELTYENIVNFFAENPYKLLYIKNNQKLVSIINKKIFPTILICFN